MLETVRNVHDGMRWGLRSNATPSMVALLMTLLMSGCYRQPKPQPLVPPPMIPTAAMIPPPEGLPPANETPVISAPPAVPAVVASKPKPKPRNHRISDLPKTTPAPPNGNNPADQPDTPATPAPRI